jgi:hypothetical protein
LQVLFKYPLTNVRIVPVLGHQSNFSNTTQTCNGMSNNTRDKKGVIMFLYKQTWSKQEQNQKMKKKDEKTFILIKQGHYNYSPFHYFLEP